MSAELVAAAASDNDLSCPSQELIPWGGTRRTIDCLSVLTPSESAWARPTRTLVNPGFTAEAAYLARLAELYDDRRD